MVRQLKNVSEIPELAGIVPPVGLYKTARVGKKREPDSIPSAVRMSGQDFDSNATRTSHTLEPSSHIYHSPPYPIHSANSHHQLPAGSWPIPGPSSQLPTLSTILPGGNSSPSSHHMYLQAGGPLSPEIVSPHSAAPSREYFVSSPPHSSPASSSRSAPCPPATPPYETQELPSLSQSGLTGGPSLPTPTNSAFSDFRGLPPLELAPTGRLPARGLEDERALWALTNNFNR
jgi:hypothetical protein